MKAAIIGFPQSGKSTLFTAVTSVQPHPGEPAERWGTAHVAEPRLGFLADLYKPKKVTRTTFEFADIPGFSLADAKGRADLKRFLPTLRNCDLLVLVVRDFNNAAVPLYRNRIDPKADIAELHEELIFADLEIVANRVEKLEKALVKPTKTHEQEKREVALLKTCRNALENSEPLSTVIRTEDDAHMVRAFAFLTEKPAVVVYNVDDNRVSDYACTPPAHVHAALALCADIEAQIGELDDADRAAFLADMGVTEPACDRLTRQCYEAMGMITFLTAGEPEVRAWSIPKGATAVEAAGKIHSDLARGFIRAETVAYDDLVAAGDLRSAKAAGKVRQEGKTYVMQDGDVVNIKFNV